jgi:hypothetical protein
MIWSDEASRSKRARDPYSFQHGHELWAVAAVPGGDHQRQRQGPVVDR